MATVSSSTSQMINASNSKLSLFGDIEALKLKVGPVRRNLFGPVDHNQLQRDFDWLLSVGVEAANKRWNFDFRNEKPCEGSNVEWEEMQCQDVPAFYRNCMVKASSPPSFDKRRVSSSSDEGSLASTSSSGSGEEYLEVTTRECYRLIRQEKRRQSAITGECRHFFLKIIRFVFAWQSRCSQVGRVAESVTGPKLNNNNNDTNNKFYIKVPFLYFRKPYKKNSRLFE